MSLIFDSLKDLYRKGDLSGYLEFYASLSNEDITAEISLLSVHAFCTLGNWKETEKCLLKLQDSDFPIYSAKACLLKQEIDFLLNGYSVEKANCIFENCDNARQEFPQDEFMCFAEEIKYKIRSVMLTWGILNAEEKKEHIEKGKRLFEKYFVTDKAHSFDFLATLVNDSFTYPCPEPIEACNLVNTYQSWMDASDATLDTVPVYLASITPLLRLKYPEVQTLTQNRLPIELEELLQFCTEAGFVATKAFVESKYGSHLLELENVEGITWIASSIKEFIHYGYFKQADSFYKQAIGWLESNSQTALLHVFEQDNKIDTDFLEFPYKKETEILEILHRNYCSGDYELAMKLATEYLENSVCENIRVGILCMMVNSGNKLGVSKKLLYLIDAEIERLRPLKNSVLLAECYYFKALVENVYRNKHWLMAAELFHNTGYWENELQCRLDYMGDDIARIADPSVRLLSESAIVDNFQIICSQLESITFLPNRYALRGKYCQYYGLACLNQNIHEAFKYLKEAEKFFGRAGNWRLYAINIHYSSGILISLARRNRNIQFYIEAIHLLKKGIKILSESEMIDFVWRLNFLLFVCHSEILQYEMVEPDKLKQFITVTETLLNEALDNYALLFSKIRPSDNSERIVASISLYKDGRQLLEQGFFFFYLEQKWDDCILWLEKCYSRSLSSILSNNLSLPFSTHPLVGQENELRKISNGSISITKSRELQRKLDSLYMEMLDIPQLRVYAQSKLKFVPDYPILQSKIVEEELRLVKNQKLFFVYYYLAFDNIYLFVVSSEWEHPCHAKIPISANYLKEGWEKLQTGLEPDDDFYVKYSALVKPLSGCTAPNDIICFIPHGFIHNLPLHAFILDGEPLIVRNPVFYNSSILTWDYIRLRKCNEGKNIFSKINIIGDPNRNLEYARQEAEEIANIFDVKAVIGNISKELFLEQLSTASLFHFAGHGNYNEGSGFLARLRLSQGVAINAREIVDLRLDMELAVLSACETGKYKVYSGDEQLGLSSALLMAGAKSVVSSLWQVDDEVTKLFFISFYKYLKAGESKIMALRMAMIDIRKVKKQTCFWAAFILREAAL